MIKSLNSLKEQLRMYSSIQKNISYQYILTTYLIERAVLRITTNTYLFDKLVFKGGFVGLKQFGTQRYTVDLDAIVMNADIHKIIDEIKLSLIAEYQDYSWFHFENQTDLLLQNEYGGTRLHYRMGLLPHLKEIKRAQILHIDLGVGDPVTPAPLSISTPSILQDSTIKWQIYPAETICAEKLHALYTKGSINSRSKDVFDLALLLPKVDPEYLKLALTRTFSYRGDDLQQPISKKIKALDLTLLKRGWPAATASISENMDFETAFSIVINELVKKDC